MQNVLGISTFCPALHPRSHDLGLTAMLFIPRHNSSTKVKKSTGSRSRTHFFRVCTDRTNRTVPRLQTHRGLAGVLECRSGREPVSIVLYPVSRQFSGPGPWAGLGWAGLGKARRDAKGLEQTAGNVASSLTGNGNPIYTRVPPSPPHCLLEGGGGAEG